MAFQVAQLVKNPPAMPKTPFQSLDWEDLLEKVMTTQSSIFAWRIPWTEEPGRLQSMGPEIYVFFKKRFCVCVCVRFFCVFFFFNLGEKVLPDLLSSIFQST